MYTPSQSQETEAGWYWNLLLERGTIMTNVRKSWETPHLEVFGSMEEMTRMPVPPGCAPEDCSSHKGFTNPASVDGSDQEHSHPPDDNGFPGGS